MPASTERVRAWRARQKKAGLKRVDILRPATVPKSVAETLKYMRNRIEADLLVVITARSARELLEYLK